MIDKFKLCNINGVSNQVAAVKDLPQSLSTGLLLLIEFLEAQLFKKHTANDCVIYFCHSLLINENDENVILGVTCTGCNILHGWLRAKTKEQTTD